jgi:hypothetical protein
VQDAPDREVLVGAVARFLAEAVLPAIEDRALAFRVRIAAHVLGGVARELVGETVLDDAHLRALLAALGEDDDIGPATTAATRDAIRAASRRLADRIRDDEWTDAELADVREVLRRLLAARIHVGNPKFALGDDIEAPQ